MPRITPNLWFDTDGLEAAEFYVSVFPNSSITNVTHYGEAGPREAGMVMTVDFVLDGQPYTAINGGPDFQFDEAISLLIECADQDEVDHYWSTLSEGGAEVVHRRGVQAVATDQLDGRVEQPGAGSPADRRRRCGRHRRGALTPRRRQRAVRRGRSSSWRAWPPSPAGREPGRHR